MHGGKNLRARIVRPGVPETERDMIWAAHERIEIRRGPAVKELPLRGLPYLLPHVRVQRLVHTILSTRWDSATWPIVQSEMPRVLELREQVAREGWWN
jgi:hypothetical protein